MEDRYLLILFWVLNRQYFNILPFENKHGTPKLTFDRGILDMVSIIAPGAILAHSAFFWVFSLRHIHFINSFTTHKQAILYL
jgi:hypothetical protein